MRKFFRTSIAVAVLALSTAGASAAPAEVVTASTSFGALSLPYTRGFNQTLSPFQSPYTTADYFLSDYGFSINSPGSFSSAVVTFNLGTILGLSDLSVNLLSGTPWAGAVPTALSAAQITSRNGSILASSSSSGGAQVISSMILAAGDYTVQVRGRVTGQFGGSYAGVMNVAAVPEPSAFALALAGFGLLGSATRRAKR
jgi:hypothetical protein